MAYDKVLAERVAKTLGNAEDIVKKEKMGGLSFMIDRKVLTRIEENHLIVRCTPDETEHLLLKPHVRRYKMKGKDQMKGWLTIAPAGTETQKDLKFWLDICVAFLKQKN